MSNLLIEMLDRVLAEEAARGLMSEKAGFVDMSGPSCRSGAHDRHLFRVDPGVGVSNTPPQHNKRIGFGSVLAHTERTDRDVRDGGI